MAHPRRSAHAAQLCLQAPDLGLRTVFDPEPGGPPNALRAARAAWRAADPAASHCLLVQDDVELQPGFVERLRTLVAAHPDAALALFTEWGSRTATSARVAALCGCPLATVTDTYLPTQAIVLPSEVARAFIRYTECDSADEKDDDVALYLFARMTGLHALVSVPNLVDHLDVPSVIGHDLSGARRSVCLLSDAPDAPAVGPIAPELHWVPFLSWWKLTAMVSVVDATTRLGRSVRPVRDVLEEHAIGWSEVTSSLADALARIPLRELVEDRLSVLVLTELWATAYALGWIAGIAAASVGSAPRLDLPAARASIATLAPGALRRILPAQWLGPVSRALEPLVGIAITSGAARVDPHAVDPQATARRPLSGD